MTLPEETYHRSVVYFFEEEEWEVQESSKIIQDFINSI